MGAVNIAESSARQGGPALEAMYRFLLWLIPAVEKFPRSQKFLLGDRIQNTALDVLERLIAKPRIHGNASRRRVTLPMLPAANPPYSIVRVGQTCSE